MVHLELKLLSNVGTTLEQPFNFDAVAATSLQGWVLAVRLRLLTTPLSQRCVSAGKLPVLKVYNKDIELH